MFGLDRRMHDLVFGAVVADAAWHAGRDGGDGRFVWGTEASLMLATCDSLVTCGILDVSDMFGRLCLCGLGGAYTSDRHPPVIDGSLTSTLVTGLGHPSFDDVGVLPLERVMPLALTDATDVEVRMVSAMTHASHAVCSTCVELVCLLRSVAASGGFIRRGLDLAVSSVSSDADGVAHEALRRAVHAFASADGYEDCVRSICASGDSSASSAGIAGGFAGLCWGVGSIPSAWLDVLPRRDFIDSVLS